MAVAKRVYQNIGVKLVFLFFLVFPFGQLIYLKVYILDRLITIRPIDVIALFSTLLFILCKARKPQIAKTFSGFLVVSVFSTILSFYFFPIRQVLVNSLYLLRLFSYFSFFVLIWNLISGKKIAKEPLYLSLISVSAFTSIFAWIQYFWIPDLTSLKYIGWDDHLGRLIGTFLDPGFTGIVLTLGFLLAATLYFEKKNNFLIVLAVFFLVSILFTYSRASYIAVFAGGAALLFFLKSKVLITLIFLLFVISLPFLPRTKGEGVRLERTQSVYARLSNYRQTVSIFKNSPLFGVGFSNVCIARISLFGGQSSSHSCSGSDSSLLFVLATSGVIGLITFLFLTLRILTSVKKDLYGISFVISSTTLFVHSLFVDSLFYPWVMGWMAILLATAVKEYKTR